MTFACDPVPIPRPAGYWRTLEGHREQPRSVPDALPVSAMLVVLLFLVILKKRVDLSHK